MTKLGCRQEKLKRSGDPSFNTVAVLASEAAGSALLKRAFVSFRFQPLTEIHQDELTVNIGLQTLSVSSH